MATEVTIKTNKVTAVQNKLTTAMKAATNLMNALYAVDQEVLEAIAPEELKLLRRYSSNAMAIKNWSCDVLDVVVLSK